LLVTDRPAVRALFRSFEVDAEAADADVAVVDVSLDPAAGIQRCRDLQQRRADLPIVGVFCCPSSLTPWNLRALLASGVSGVLDLQGTVEDAVRTIETVARGGSVFHLQLRRGQRELLRDLLMGGGSPTDTQLRLLELVARGLSDREIGMQLHLSPHTVKHHIEQVRHELRIRNRTELAAWAGRNGFYDRAEETRGPLVPLRLTSPPAR
jgi:two-component system response regulator DevR